MKNYIENRELILSSFAEDRKFFKELFLSILNGGFKDIYSDNKQTNNYLKLFENEIIRIQNYFYINDKRYLDIDYNYKGKNLSQIILDIENQILQIMINYFTSKNVNILTLEYDGLKIYTDRNSKHFSINELELNIYKNIGINIKLAFKNIVDNFSEFGIRCNTDNIKNKNIIENKIKIVHHDHCLEKNNIIGYICRECNLQIKNKKTIPMYFFNGQKYDNSITGHLHPNNADSALHGHVASSNDPECGFHFEDVKILETGKYDEQIRFIESILLKYDKQNLNTCERSIKLEIV